MTEKSKGKLYLVPTPIGNYEDITLRALKVLQEVSFIICEEKKEARRLLSRYQISKELIELNEHNEKEHAPLITGRIKNGDTAALISDCGTPLFSDPGHFLVDLCIMNKIMLIPLPGANSILPALISSGMNIEKFYYYGWLSPKKDKRKQELLKLKKINELIILLDTPYRLLSLLRDVVKYFDRSVNIFLAYNLTMQDERLLRGSADKVLSAAESEKMKGEFVLLIDNRRGK